jgi:6-phosphogluconolactonase (cycloisomerase 2 family)
VDVLMTVTRRALTLAGLGAIATAIVAVAQPADAATPSATAVDQPGAVFTETNAATGNAVVVLRRDRSGRLTVSARYATGGLGTGAGLGSQGAVTLSPDGRYLLAVNAGSHSVTAFAVTGRRWLHRLSTVDSSGTQPISVTTSGDLVYVVNAGDAPTVSGFRLDQWGLHPITGSTRPVAPGGAGPAQIGFTPDGRHLVVTLKPSNRIDTFQIDDHGRARAPVSTMSTGNTPFGFSFDPAGHLLVSNAEGGAAGASTVTSYRLGYGGRLTVVSGPVKTGQAAACWLVVTPDGRYAYTTNTGSNNLSSFAVAHSGQLTLTAGAAATTGAGPIDAGFTPSGRTLYALTGPGHSIAGFTVDPATGRLTALSTAADLPAGLVGLAVS